MAPAQRRISCTWTPNTPCSTASGWCSCGRCSRATIRRCAGLAIYLCSALAISAGLWFFNPEIDWYVGASGALHGVMTAGTLAHLRRRDLDGWILAVFIVAKLAYEQFAGAMPFAGDASTIVDAHLYGAIGGLVAGAASCARAASRSEAQSLYFAPMSNNSTRFRISRPGIPVGRHARQARRRIRRRARHLRRGIDSAGLRPVAAVPAGPGRRAQRHRTHPARDAGRRHRDLAPVAGARGRRSPPSSPATASANSPRWSPPAPSTFAACVDLVRFRGQVMQEAVPAGTRRDGRLVRPRGCRGRSRLRRSAAQGGVVEAVNFNSPGQVVIAGEKAAVLRAIEAAKARGAKRAIELPVSVPSHSSLMKSAGARLGERLATTEIRAPRIRYLSAVDAQRARRSRRHPRAAGAAAVEPGALDRDRRRPEQRRRRAASSNAARAACSPAWSNASRSGARHADLRARRSRIFPRPRLPRPQPERNSCTCFENDIALVTGASRGIGQAIAKALAGAGAQVIGTATTRGGSRRASLRGLEATAAARCSTWAARPRSTRC